MKKELKKIALGIFAILCTVSIVKAQTALEGIRAIEVEQFESAKRIFSTLIADPKSISAGLKVLIEEEIIEVNQHYQPGVFCKSYKSFYVNFYYRNR